MELRIKPKAQMPNCGVKNMEMTPIPQSEARHPLENISMVIQDLDHIHQA